MKKILIIVSVAFGFILASCKSGDSGNAGTSDTTATSRFGKMGTTDSFKNAHASPVAYNGEKLTGEMVELKTSDGKPAKAYLAKAAVQSDKFLIMCHEWWGLNDFIKHEADRYASELGNVNVLAVDLYDGRVTTNPDEASKFMNAVDESRIRTIINASFDYTGKNAELGTIGWCFGGGWSLQASIMAGNRSKACVMFYGMPEDDLAKLKNLQAPVLGLFARKDKWINPDVVSKFEKNMKSLHKSIETKEYDADHAFANPSNPNYNKSAAADAHALAIGFLKRHLSEGK